MVTANELRAGMALRIDNEVYRVLEVESKAGAAKMGGLVRAKLCNVKSKRMWEQHFRQQEKLEDVGLERRKMEFLFSDGDTCTFLRMDTFEQVEVPAGNLGLAEKYLQPGMELSVEFFEEDPVNVVLPDVIECRVITTAPPARSQQEFSKKEATLENGQTIQVPLFIAPGEIVRVDPKSGKYIERARLEHKKGA